MKYLIPLLILFLFPTHHAFSQKKVEQQVSYFDLSDVRLIESPFLHAQELDKKYLLEMEADRLLAPFLREAGLTPKAESYTNWENTGLDGHIGGHYVSALAMMFASTGDKMIKERLDYMLSEWNRVQDANGNGYIGGVPESDRIWREIKEGKIRAGGFSLNGGWVPLYNIHKTFTGLKDAYIYTGSELAKEMLVKLTDWMIDVTKELSDEQMQDMLRSEHGGLNEVFADVADITGNSKYLELAKRFSHRYILEPLVKGEDKLTGLHANTQIPKVIGYQRIAQLEKNREWADAAAFFWDEVVNKRSVCIGGNSAFEHFHPEDDYSRMIQGTQGPETCNTYNMLRLTKLLYQGSLDKSYIDYYERALYNHILSSQHPETGGLVYFTQMRPGHYRVYSQPHTSFWCCVGSGIENHAKYGEMIYAHTDKALYVNLFIPSTVTWQEKGIKLIQRNKFPKEAATHFTVEESTNKSFTLNIRNPEWVAKGAAKVSINGEPFDLDTKNSSYISIKRKWKKGDQVFVELPMEMRTEQMPDGSNYFAYLYGPMVLAAKTGQQGMEGLFADDSRGGHIAQGEIIPLNEIPFVVSHPDQLLSQITSVADKELHFQLSGLQGGDKETLVLIPFFDLHESRYIIYFPQATPEELVVMQKEMEAREAAARKLDAITSDVVNCGEQQPESDHFIENTGTWTGYIYENHWREGGGWFSYQMKNEEQKAKYLYIKYLDIDRNRHASFMVNGEKMGDLSLEGDEKERIKVFYFPLPYTLQKEKKLEVAVEAIHNAWMPKMVEVRLLDALPGK